MRRTERWLWMIKPKECEIVVACFKIPIQNLAWDQREKPLKVGCLHPVACTRSGSGFPSNATLFWIFYSIIAATCFGYYWIKDSKQCCVRRKPWLPSVDGHTTETCSGYYWIKYSKQCWVRWKPWFPSEDGHTTETCSGYYWIKYSKQCCVGRKPWFPSGDGHTTETCSGYYWIKYSKQCCVWRKPWFPSEDGHTTETCSGYWIKYSKQCCVRRKPRTWENHVKPWSGLLIAGEKFETGNVGTRSRSGAHKTMTHKFSYTTGGFVLRRS
jgi:hypothetical protein